MRLRDKVVIVTGAASGIGRATVEVCAEEGAVIVAADLPSSRLLELATSGGADRPTLAVPADVTKLEACRAVVEAAFERWGRIDALVNCAGILQGGFVPV